MSGFLLGYSVGQCMNNGNETVIQNGVMPRPTFISLTLKDGLRISINVTRIITIEEKVKTDKKTNRETRTGVIYYLGLYEMHSADVKETYDEIMEMLA